MTLDISCPHCAKQYKVPDSYAGRKARCKACGNEMTILAPSPEIDALEDLPSAEASIWSEDWVNNAAAGKTLAPLAPPPKSVPRPMARPAPARRRRVPWVVLPDKLSRAALPLIILGVAFLVAGFRDWRLAAHSNATPKKTTLGDLAAHGPGDNLHVELSEFRLLPDQAVIETEEKYGVEMRWTYVWIPAVASDRFDHAGPGDIKVIVGTAQILNEDGIDRLCRQTTLRGLVVNETDSIKAGAQKLLNEGLPGVDIASCWFFREGQGPKTGGVLGLFLGGGALALLAGLVIGGLSLQARLA